MTKPNPFGPKGWTPENLGSLKGKTYVITGANIGIGYEAAKLLASKGAEVIIMCRNQAKGQAAIDKIKNEVGNEAILSLIAMDLSSLASVRKAADEVRAAAPKIDALICNAGVGSIKTREITEDGFERHIAVNVLGHFLLTGLLFDIVEASQGRVVFVGSITYRAKNNRVRLDDLDFGNGYQGLKCYAHSKLAFMTLAYELQRRLASSGSAVQVQVCHPGIARTNLSNEKGSLLTVATFKMIGPFIQSAEQGGWPTVLCATEDNLEPEKFYGPTGLAEVGGPIGESKLLGHALDRDTAGKLWAACEERTGFGWSI